MKKAYYMTRQGVDEMKAELTELISQRGPVAERIKTAREFGDLAENAEYSSALQEQDRVESRIHEIQNILQNAEVIAKPKNDKSIKLGLTVKLKSQDGKTKQFQVVGTVEADPLNGKISNESPIGKELMGRKAGDKIDLKNVSYTIVGVA